jgi:phenylalanyl-tRNA synthetase beta chain
MRVPLEWLYEHCDPGLDVVAVEERLTMTGTKVEAIHHHGVRALEHFVVGRVLEAARHPDADRLTVCRVDVGGDHVATIVCGAPNVAAGQTVAVARPGAVMPDGRRLEAATLRGVVSEGMILAEDEMAVGVEHDGILVLDDLVVDAEFAPGTPLADVLPIATEVLELEITPNRPDCLAVYGVARELHAATGAALSEPPWADDPGGDGEVAGAEVMVQCPELCPRFTLRRFEDVTVAPSPPWLKARLMAAGQRPINNVVDITNYVMLLTGQPTHAFDADRVAGGRLEVRTAAAGETIETLDGQRRTLDEQIVIIEDAQGPTSIAGVMGGARSEVTPQSTRVLLEAATWDGPNIHRTSWRLGLRSEASSRFEKGLAPEQTLFAQAVAGRLMIQLCGARLAPGTVDIGGPGPPPVIIRLRERRVADILGAPIERECQTEILEALDFGVEPAADGLDVSVPPLRRADITREVDLIEEVGRIDGIDKLPATLPKRRGAYGRLTREQRLRRRAVDALVGRGLNEVVGWTFTAPALLDRLRLAPGDERRDVVTVENALSADQSLLRPTLLGSLLDIARHNVARGPGDLRLFEVGTVFVAGTGSLPHEHCSLGMLLGGRVVPPTWRTPDPPSADFFAAKGELEALSAALRVEVNLVPASEPFLHPARAARIYAGDTPLGWVGELHPLVAAEWELDTATSSDGGRAAHAVLELDLDRLIALAPTSPRYEDLVSFPAVRQDLAVIVPDDVAAAAVLATVRGAAGGLLDDVHVFDVYTGPQVGEGRRSLALALSLRARDRTLTDEDVLPVRGQIVQALARELGGELRA